MARNIYKKILKIEEMRQKLLLELFSIREMVQGSFCLIYVKCGNKRCRCNHGELHPHYRMSMRRNGKQMSRAVPKDEYEWITKATENYRNFRTIVKKIVMLEDKSKKLINLYEKELVKRSSKGKAYLPIENEISGTKSEIVPENSIEKMQENKLKF